MHQVIDDALAWRLEDRGHPASFVGFRVAENYSFKPLPADYPFRMALFHSAWVC
jgi:hypothetical protein